MPDPKPPNQPVPVPLGEALNSSDEELDAESIIQPSDIERAKVAARRHGRGTDLSKMLDAEVE